MTRSLSLLFFVAVLAGCAMNPGHVSTSKSTFDGATQWTATPAWVYNGWSSTGFKLGLHRNSKMPPNEVILRAVAKDAVNISAGDSLHFNFSGDVVSLQSIDATTAIEFDTPLYTSSYSSPGAAWASKRYTVDLAFLQRLVSASNVTVRLDLDRSYMEGTFSSDAPTTARPAFRRFLRALTSNSPPNAIPSRDARR